ncbi:hypothetical protein SAMN05421503_1433 [Terribacillus aidingensis]|uniref:Uncharacterized protein n=1 Tax=Terribacillus aidingensis TaxID=586416 RepID=A0A285NKF8_9BACI|nr:hypothetical protein [Terribacillus aidingensis]SNZ09949.1 hypothetical protein SAMN05421503_1433 [Terribacillus aidingensis]
MKLNTGQLRALMSRVRQNQMQETDKADIKSYIKAVFNDGYTNPDPSMLHQFNNLVVEQADQIAKPVVTDILGIMADLDTAAPGTFKQLKIPQKNKAKVMWSATGSGVDLVRVEGRKTVTLEPQHLSTGFYYEPLDLVRDSVEFFNKLVNDVAQAKVRLYLDNIYKLIEAARASGKIPAANIAAGSNLTLTQYNKVASTLQRYGGRPVFIGDALLVDHFAMQQASDNTFNKLLTDDIKKELLTALNPTTIGRTTAVTLVNPFLDETNSKTELPVNKGFMFAGGVSQKPFSVVEYGGLKQTTATDMEDERIKMKLTQDASVTMVFGEAIGLVKEDAAVQL